MLLRFATGYAGSFAASSTVEMYRRNVVRYRSAMNARRSLSVTATKIHGCRFPPLGAKVPASHTLRINASGTGSGRNRRMCRHVRIASNRRTSSPIVSTSMFCMSPPAVHLVIRVRVRQESRPAKQAGNSSMLIAHDRLARFATRVFVACGATETVAGEVADYLVSANLKGHDSHGVGMIPAYVRNARAKLLDPAAPLRVLKDNRAVLLVDGQMGFGQVVGREATELAIARAKETGVVCVGLRNAHHLGRIGAYGEPCGRAGLVSLHFLN